MSKIELIQSIDSWRAIRRSLNNKTVGFVPTMGNLHEGHISLVRRSVDENDITVLSCFVNPTQFNNTNDFENYPHTVQEDMDLCGAAGVDYFFSPEYDSMYPDDYRYKVTEKEISGMMEGEHRPGHFDGMLTIVLKLLLLMKADNAYFGEKDYQQLQLVEGMANAFFLDTRIVPCATIRNEFNLALSSRNGRLTEDQMALSRYFPEYLHSNHSCDDIVVALTEKGFEVEYIEEHKGRRFGAVRLGDVRLIDNVEVE